MYFYVDDPQLKLIIVLFYIGWVVWTFAVCFALFGDWLRPSLSPTVSYWLVDVIRLTIQSPVMSLSTAWIVGGLRWIGLKFGT